MVQIDLLQQIVDFVRSNPVPQLDLRFYKRSVVDTPCGTSHCILGWCAENGAAGLSVMSTNFTGHHYREYGLQGRDYVGSIGGYLGLKSQQFTHLFLPDDYPVGFTQTDVLNRIQTFINSERENG